MTQLYKKILSWISFAEQPDTLELLIVKVHHSQVEHSFTIEPYFQSLKRSYQQKNINFCVWDSENEHFQGQLEGVPNPKLKKIFQKHGQAGSILVIDASQTQLIDKFSADMLFSEMNQRVLAYV